MEQIILNENFPRSVIYSVNHLHKYFNRLKNDNFSAGYNEIDFMIGKLQSKVKFSTSDSIIYEGLHQFLIDTKTSLFQIGTTLSKNYFGNSYETWVEHFKQWVQQVNSGHMRTLQFFKF